MAHKVFYNVSLVEREHKHLCSLQNKLACTEYTVLYSKMSNEVIITLNGNKSGTHYRARGISFESYPEDLSQPSHLTVHFRIAKTLLKDPLHTYPCFNAVYHNSDDVRFTLCDVDAVRALVERLDVRYHCILPILVRFFVDWTKLDALREKRSAAAIQRALLERLYAPDGNFYRTQTRHDWKSHSQVD